MKLPKACSIFDMDLRYLFPIPQTSNSEGQDKSYTSLMPAGIDEVPAGGEGQDKTFTSLMPASMDVNGEVPQGESTQS